MGGYISRLLGRLWGEKEVRILILGLDGAVDSIDRDRMSTSREELHAMLDEEELREAALLVFANKQDMVGALTSAEVSDALGLSTLKNRQWSIYKTSAVKGDGLNEGLDW
ncbi:20077_t:CDS:2 [Cetraspora pellucida]|uniref:20077_t:CDS:1 n=1 Tax=Cetraspora pellucida TaxID=1433469 RepID=A0A9N9FZL4_9GLOM|nr:20077_t:CDS:2 [Cetraspora pellucida]